jgi:hypothetical protein
LSEYVDDGDDMNDHDHDDDDDDDDHMIYYR